MVLEILSLRISHSKYFTHRWQLLNGQWCSAEMVVLLSLFVMLMASQSQQ